MKDAALPILGLGPTGAGGSLASIEQELLAEKASALALAGDNLAAALAVLAQVDAALADASPEQRSDLAPRRRKLRDEAAERLWYLLVQREAIGLFQHEAMLREQRVPVEVRLLAGPRRR